MSWSHGLLAVVLLGCGSDKAPSIECGKGTVLKDGKCETVAAAAPAATPVAVQDASVAPLDAAPVSAWKYETKTDTMRGVSSNIASITSTDEVDLGPPYGRARLEVIVRHDPVGAPVPGDHVIVAVLPGQIDCRSDGCAISYKVDARPVARTIAFEMSSTRNAAVFLDGDGKWAANLNGATYLTIEVPLYGHAPHQFKFDVSGFKSPIPVAKPQKAAAKAKKEWCYNVEGGPDAVCWPTSDECAMRQANAGNSALNGCKEW